MIPHFKQENDDGSWKSDPKPEDGIWESSENCDKAFWVKYSPPTGFNEPYPEPTGWTSEPMEVVTQTSMERSLELTIIPDEQVIFDLPPDNRGRYDLVMPYSDDSIKEIFTMDKLGEEINSSWIDDYNFEFPLLMPHTDMLGDPKLDYAS